MEINLKDLMGCISTASFLEAKLKSLMEDNDFTKSEAIDILRTACNNVCDAALKTP